MSRHPVPVLYGFKKLSPFSVYLDDGSFFGTLSAGLLLSIRGQD